MEDILTFQQAIEESSNYKKRHLLLGNGFSIDWKPNVFRYDSLFERADFKTLDNRVRRVFDVLGITDFEVVMKHLRAASEILKIYSPSETDVIKHLAEDAENLKSVLVNAIASSHPDLPTNISESEYQHCKEFLSKFDTYYTLNYDLLLYWVAMHFQESGEIFSDDGFRTPDTGQNEYVSWDIEKTDGQNLFYLHGALHVFDAKSELQKYTWINTGVRLIQQIRDALDRNYYPVFVSEGRSTEKLEKIVHSNYLSRGMRSFAHISGCLFVHGHSLAVNDSHILNLIPKSNIQKVFVSIHGDQDKLNNNHIIRAAKALTNQRKKKLKLEVRFYDSESAHVWR